jgi:hypothetical protein
MDTIEKFHIHKDTHLNNQNNGKNIAKPNLIFDMLIHKNASRGRLYT